MDSDYPLFFERLSERLRIETNVSDVLYALLHSSQDFRSIFGKIFNIAFERGYSIEREVVFPPDCRVDLLIRSGNPRADIIEIKLADKDYHYEEYSAIRIAPEGTIPSLHLLAIDFPPATIPLTGWTKVSWSHLIEKMEQSRDSMVLAVAHYFKGATHMEKIEVVDFSKPRGMLYFNRLVKSVIRASSDQSTIVELFNRGDSFLEDGSGYYFSASCGQKQFWPWFGLSYNDLHEGVMIWIRRDWNKLLSNRFEQRLKSEFGDNCTLGDRDIVIMLPKSSFDQFVGSGSTRESQREVLQSFLTQFLGVVASELSTGP